MFLLGWQGVHIRVTVRATLVGVGNLPPAWVVNQPMSHHKPRHALDRHLRVTAHCSDSFQSFQTICENVCVWCAHVKHRIFTGLLLHSKETKQQKAEKYISTNSMVLFRWVID